MRRMIKKGKHNTGQLIYLIKVVPGKNLPGCVTDQAKKHQAAMEGGSVGGGGGQTERQGEL